MKNRVTRNIVWLRNTAQIVSSVLLFFSFGSCSITKKVHQGEYLLNTNKVIYRFGNTQKNKGLNTIANIGIEGIDEFKIPRSIIPSEIQPYIKQKPNTRILFIIPFYLYLYDLPDSAKTMKRKEIRDSLFRIKAVKKGWSDSVLARKINRKTGRQWLMSQGEAPVILDTSLAQKSTEQIRTFLMNKGFFDAQVKDSIHLKTRKADVAYIIKPGKPYRVTKVVYYFEDPDLASEVLSDTVDCKIRRNEMYDKDMVDAESDRITKQLNNAGFFYFSKQYVNYILDSNKTKHEVEVEINIKKFAMRKGDNKDSIVETSHPWYKIGNVTVQMNFNPTRASFYHADDTLVYNAVKIEYPGGVLAVKPNKLCPKIFIKPGDVYRIGNLEDTYTGLSQLNEFSYISIKYIPRKDSNYVDCIIQLMPMTKLSYGAELEATNTGGDAGLQGDLLYQNHNQLKGAEQLTFKLNGGLIAQQVLGGGSSQTFNKYIPLNTIDFGPELDLTIPRPIFPFNFRPYSRYANTQTTFKLTFNYQQRPDYIRHVFGAAYSLDWNPMKNRHSTLTLLEVNLVNADLSPAFADLLQQYNLYFQNSFKNQFITDSRFTKIFDNQYRYSPNHTHFGYIKFNIENSGFWFWALTRADVLKLPVNSVGSYYFNGIAPYSQYTKADIEYKFYLVPDKREKLVWRIYAGGGLPYGNSSELPFSKSFWAGGSNDIRAWQVQTLGPGGSPYSAVAGQIGETKLEGNFEYRVSLIKYFGLAYFIDAGNIWLWNNAANESVPLSTFQTNGANPFWSEIAIGTGVGLRLDFNYFVIRIDFGQPVRDPSRDRDNRFIPLHEYTIKRTIINFGIGYPF